MPPTPTPRSVLKVGTPGEGADPDATEGVRGETALHLAVRADSSLVVQLLLQAGASPDSVSVDGETALFIAAKRNDRLCMMALMAGGASTGAVFQQDERSRHRGRGGGRWGTHAGPGSGRGGEDVAALVAAAASLLEETRGAGGGSGSAVDPLNEKSAWSGTGSCGSSPRVPPGLPQGTQMTSMQLFDLAERQGEAVAAAAGSAAGLGAPLALADLARSSGSGSGSQGPTAGAMLAAKEHAALSQ